MKKQEAKENAATAGIGAALVTATTTVIATQPGAAAALASGSTSTWIAMVGAAAVSTPMIPITAAVGVTAGVTAYGLTSFFGEDNKQPEQKSKQEKTKQEDDQQSSCLVM